MLVVTDVCLCEYTDHGHCGIVDRRARSPTIRPSSSWCARRVSHAAAGADIVAPSDMMDGRVGAIRQALDERGFEHVGDHVVRGEVLLGVLRPVPRGRRSAPKFGDRRIAPDGSGQRATRRCARSSSDIEEGADIVMVKPALPYLDVIARVKDAFG